MFRPLPRGVGRALLLGAVAGAFVGLLGDVPPLLAALFGVVAAAIVTGVRQVTGVRVVASEQGVEVRGDVHALRASWDELQLGFGRSLAADGTARRFAILADSRGKSFAFADLGGARCAPVRGADGADVEIVDVRDAALLLALAVQRTPAWYVLPPELLDVPIPAPATDAPTTARLEPDAARTAAPPPGAAPGARVGIVGLLGKLVAAAGKAVKTANVGWAAASMAAYGVLFSWKFAAALLLQLFVHEYGHVHAMRRTGMKVRGMYFVPFLGAIAVTDDAFSSRRQQAYVALNGPFWGALFSLVPAGLYLWTGDPTLAAIGAWWALINLFNLLPIAPLDGGRIMQAFAFSFSSTLGVALSALGLAAAVALGTALGYALVWFIALLGVMELVSESRARAGGHALRLLPDRSRFGPRQYAYLRGVLGPPLRAGAESVLASDLERMERVARAKPLRPAEMALWGLAYAALAAGLLALLHFLAAVPGADAAARLLS